MRPAPFPVSVAMARRLARLDPAIRAYPARAAAALAPHVPAAALQAHLAEARAVAGAIAAAAASDRPRALVLAGLRDLAAVAVLAGFLGCLWAVAP